jgi:hypothetical protein
MDGHSPLMLSLIRWSTPATKTFEVFNETVQLPPDFVAAHARRSAFWLCEDVVQRAAPLGVPPRACLRPDAQRGTARHRGEIQDGLTG